MPRHHRSLWHGCLHDLQLSISVKTYTKSFSSQIFHLNRVLNRFGISGYSFMDLEIYLPIREGLPDTKIESSMIIETFKAIKTEDELNSMRRAARCTNAGTKFDCMLAGLGWRCCSEQHRVVTEAMAAYWLPQNDFAAQERVFANPAGLSGHRNEARGRSLRPRAGGAPSGFRRREPGSGGGKCRSTLPTRSYCYRPRRA